MKSFNISDIEEGLVNSLMNIFKEEKINSNFDLRKSIEERYEDIDEDVDIEDEYEISNSDDDEERFKNDDERRD